MLGAPSWSSPGDGSLSVPSGPGEKPLHQPLVVMKCVGQEALEEDKGCVRRNPGTAFLEFSKCQAGRWGEMG